MKRRLAVAALMLALSVGAMAQGNRFAGVRGSVVGVTPCDTDSDCEAKNPVQSDSGGINKTGTAYFYCEAITKSGKRCRHHVREAGLLCPQHSKMVKEGKTVKTID